MFWVDILILSLLAISALVGWFRGLFRELLSLLIWLAACGLASYRYAELSPYLTFLAQPIIRDAAARVLLLLFALLVGSIINTLLARLLDALGLSMMDRFLGLGFGLLRGGVILGATLFFWQHYFHGAQHSLWQHSQLISEVYQWLEEALQAISGSVAIVSC